MEKKNKTVIDYYNDLVDTMNDLLDKGYDIWEFHDNYRGYGFMTITEGDLWVNCWINYNLDEPSEYIITLHNRQGTRVFDSISQPTIKEEKTIDASQVEGIILKFLESIE